MISSLFILLLSAGMPTSALHPIHISKFQLEHDQDTHTLQGTLHIFIDDLELGIELAGLGNELKLGTNEESDSANVAIRKYVNQHLRVNVNGSPVEFEFIGKELSDDYMAFWCYIESPSIQKISDMTVEYDILMEVYDDQKNIFNFVSNDREEEYFLFRSAKQKFTFLP